MSQHVELVLEARVGDRPTEYAFRTRDGVHAAGEFRPAELALLDVLWEATPDSLLHVEANYGVVGTVLAERSTVTMTESSARAAGLCERNAAANDAFAAVERCAGPSALDGSFDAAAYTPKPYTPLAVGKQRLVDALDALDPGGRLYVAGTREAGIRRYAELLADECDGTTRVVDRDGVRVVAGVRPPRYDPPSFVEPRTLTPTVDGTDLSLVSVPGLFSATGLDHGTRLLLESVDVEDGARVLDLCCGYGAMGVYAALTADCEVHLTDDDSVATRCAACSLDASGVDGTVVTADATAGVAGRTFDRILCNPPTHAGSGVLRDVLGGAGDVLAPDGTLTLVHHRALDLSGHLDEFDVSTRAVGEEHVVLDATR